MIVLLLGEMLHFMLIFTCFEGCYDFTAKILSRSSSQFSLFHYFHKGLFGFRHYIMDSSSLLHLGPYNAFKDVPLKRYIFFVFFNYMLSKQSMAPPTDGYSSSV